jgi:hypothetical protein
MVSPQAYKGGPDIKERERERETREEKREIISKLDPCGVHLGIDPYEEQSSNSCRTE